ncbi:endoplasmic reticulum metallopeptidase 1-like isoform X2 [Chrysoperla carnea]|uniref:endoplasmic reticulum metallopeptidase 1-like isoform X2 n=1 Tax=Chrysoperla carnea TaxID=189513 RepID=UPI001D085856|nr:endoplasmic reticulum metallopeptidase 1-like isoform X2 [Chrysoperla carnea]
MNSNNQIDYTLTSVDENDKKQRKRISIHGVPIYAAVLLLLSLIVLLIWAVVMDRKLPTQIKIAEEKDYPNHFIGERSQQHLKQLTDIGPRVVGSYENEELAVKFLQQEIGFIKQLAHPNHEIEVDTQVVSGSYYLAFKPYGVTNVYSNVQNVVVRLSPKGKNVNSSLLLNSHFDSVPTSPGATDAGISITTMLEVLRVLSSSSQTLQHNVIFLFNGAEENPLQASHGFITQHKWAPEVRAFINMEGVGGGGKEVVFQAGPGHPWMLRYYSSVAPHPRAQVVAEELFQSNVIPSDTDFRIFRDFGHVPGVDVAFVKRGYVYHTKYDNFENVENGSYQHIGDNILALTRAIANSDELKDPQQHDSGHLVFYDFFGLTLIIYSYICGIILNLFIVILSLYTCFAYIRGITKVSDKIALKQLGLSMGAQFAGWIVGILLCILIGLFLDTINQAMSWYSRPWLVIPLFSLPTLIGCSAFLLLLGERNKKENVIGLNVQVHIHILATISLWNIVLFIGTCAGIRATHLITFTLIFPNIALLFISHTKIRQSVHSWLYLYLFCILIPVVYNIYESLTLVEFFIPISGRVGANQVVDIKIGVITAAATILVTSLIVPLICAVHSGTKLLIGLLSLNLVIIFAVWVSPLGFPYDVAPEHQMPERYWVYHTERVRHDERGKAIEEDAGYFILNMDRNSPQMITDYVEEFQLKSVSVGSFCDKWLFCGVPVSNPRMNSVVATTWIPTTAPIFHRQTNLILKDQRLLKVNVRRLSFIARGPDRMALFISPKPGSKLIGWSFLDEIPPSGPLWNDRPTYFVIYGRGKETRNDDWVFHLDIEVPQGTTDPILDITLTGHLTHDDKLQTPAYKIFLSKFPKWTQTIAWISSYKSWVF